MWRGEEARQWSLAQAAGCAGLFTGLGKIGKGAGLPLVGWLLFLGGGAIVDGRESRPLF